MTKIKVDGVGKNNYKDIDLSDYDYEDKNYEDKNYEDKNNYGETEEEVEELPVEKTQNPYSIPFKKTKMKTKYFIISGVLVFIILILSSINQTFDIEKVRQNNLKQIEEKTTSLSSEILEIKKQLADKIEEINILEKCKKENSREGKYMDCSYINK